MDTLAALMILVACHPETSNCLDEPVAVISYQSTDECRAAMPGEIERAEKLARLIYGNCVPVDPELLVGRPQIHQVIEPEKLAKLSRGARPVVNAQALADNRTMADPFALTRGRR
ncbi:hypothetical protein G6N76_22705 [Rhizobium daejeonense]|uniref:Uncharacterized protein n=1 Tax=Rhizobium daejeonense TaxID=240521 RepID=A0A6M1S7Y6_9HYPH|nr:hypothetical protein [Rhizobium daejeonense]NGO66481.1 hypothetical protein [Rhizobium daejeonense]